MDWEFYINWKIKFRDKPIYVFRDHNWAFGAWEIEKLIGNIKPNSILVHVDAHLDDCVDGVHVRGVKEINTIEDIMKVAQSYERNGQTPESNMIHIDNFIWTGIASGTIGETIFVSGDKMEPNSIEKLIQEGTSASEYYLECLPEGCSYKQEMRFQEIVNLTKHFNANEFNQYRKDHNVILDLDLDYFNKSRQYKESDLKSEDVIRHELLLLRHLYQWDVITVALSPDYCGGVAPCKFLLDTFLDVFELDFNETVEW
ncbi:UPF0489 family protein [Brevibacillus sp. HB2.2]|uniref:UPF0489 family protein n=1 Tax=Brevibacillus sp. HB2.2 TaxID=2738846 RepID=UPI00156AD4BA|nr:UPF0489 family protein [Brevibacillus sp. HB2.2]NRS52076.1 UPF0489 family protein [Brevibacillus sp. HB2.2]